MKLTQTIAWSPFSDKHKTYINAAFNSRICVAEGAIRSGKTIDHCVIAANYLETCRDKIHLASGSTIGNAKLNIGVCNGFGLENLFRGRCKWGKYRDNEALFVRTKTGEKVVVFAGGGKADSYKRILGNSYGLWIATEINEHYDSDDSRESFIKVATGRQLAALDPLILWDLNPCNPNHRIYRDYIDHYLETNLPGYLYEHFTIDDNLSIDDERREQIKAQYDPSSVWYRRDILGERCIAEGLVYPMFGPDCIVGPEDRPYTQYALSMDYGIMNPTAIILWGLCEGVWYAIKEYYHSGRETKQQKTDQQYYDDLCELAGDLPIRCLIIDPSAASFITLAEQKRRFKIWDADNAVNEGLAHTAQCITDGKIKICSNCKMTIGEFGGYMWDASAADDRPVKENDHAMDAVRYFVQTTGIWQQRKRALSF